MHLDPVYAGFVLPSLREAERRAEQAEATADRETEARRKLEEELEALRARQRNPDEHQVVSSDVNDGRSGGCGTIDALQQN